MERICRIIIVLLAVASCSVKEDRSGCPCYLGVTVTRQGERIFRSGKAWCNVFDEDGRRFEADALDGMNSRDTTLWYGVLPRRAVSVVVTNREVDDGRIVAPYGEEMAELYAFRKDAGCLPEEVRVVVDRQDKQFCCLTIRLTEEAMPFAPDLVVRVDAPYDGTSFPSLKAHGGDFLYRTVFDYAGSATVRLPRQGGEGMKLYVQKIGTFSCSYDLYDEMRMAHYDWTVDSLDDFKITVGLNSITGDLEVEDWTVVDYGDRKF